jgi:hypothetical protein
MRIVPGIAEGVCDPVNQLVRDVVFQSLGFVMHVAPIVPELPSEIELKDAVAPDHPQSGSPSLRRQLGAVVRHVLERPHLHRCFTIVLTEGNDILRLPAIWLVEANPPRLDR